ncbi:MAG: hypothetical protein HY695_23565 [Deltaproteobacteria bacterium]|nr:hypothetical protein [Deltaproteobacteria bacterium]
MAEGLANGNRTRLSSGAVPDEIRVVHNRKDKLGEWPKRSEPLYVGGEPRWFEHPVLAEKVDVVAVPLSAVDDVHL